MKGRDPFPNPRLLWGHARLTSSRGFKLVSQSCRGGREDEDGRGGGEEVRRWGKEEELVRLWCKELLQAGKKGAPGITCKLSGCSLPCEVKVKNRCRKSWLLCCCLSCSLGQLCVIVNAMLAIQLYPVKEKRRSLNMFLCLVKSAPCGSLCLCGVTGYLGAEPRTPGSFWGNKALSFFNSHKQLWKTQTTARSEAMLTLTSLRIACGQQQDNIASKKANIASNRRTEQQAII